MNQPNATGSWGKQQGATEAAPDLGIFDLHFNSGTTP
jgi:hypothetical protein